MNPRHDLNQLIEALHNQDPEVHIPAIENAVQVIQRLAEEAARTLEESPVPLAVAERIHQMGSVIAGPMERLLRESDNQEVKTQAALVLHYSGSASDLAYEWLLRAFELHDDSSCAIAWILAKEGIPNLSEILLQRLDSLSGIEPSKNTYNLLKCLLDVMHQSDWAIPSEIREEIATSIIDYLQHLEYSDASVDEQIFSTMANGLSILRHLDWHLPEDLKERISDIKGLRSLLDS